MFTNLSFWLQFIKKIIYVIFIVTYHLDCLLGRIFVFSLSFLFPLEVLSGLLEKDGLILMYLAIFQKSIFI